MALFRRDGMNMEVTWGCCNLLLVLASYPFSSAILGSFTALQKLNRALIENKKNNVKRQSRMYLGWKETEQSIVRLFGLY